MRTVFGETRRTGPVVALTLPMKVEIRRKNRAPTMILMCFHMNHMLITSQRMIQQPGNDSAVLFRMESYRR